MKQGHFFCACGVGFVCVKETECKLMDRRTVEVTSMRQCDRREGEDEQGKTARAAYKNKEVQRSSVWKKKEVGGNRNPWSLFYLAASPRNCLFSLLWYVIYWNSLCSSNNWPNISIWHRILLPITSEGITFIFRDWPETLTTNWLKMTLNLILNKVSILELN